MDLNRKTAELLGILETDDPRVLLGVTTGRTDHIAIKNALRRRLAQLHVHPSGHSEEAGEIRNHLKQIAKTLLRQSPEVLSKNSPIATELTPLDQAIIAALVCEGGWNKKSRSRLVGIAASYSISVGGLMRIMEAFSDAARSGAGPLSAKLKSAHTIDHTWSNAPQKKSPFSVLDSFISEAAKKFTPELSSPNPAMTIKLAILFSILTLIAFILSLQILLSDDTSVGLNEPEIQSTFPSNETGIPIELQFKLFEEYPTFHVEGIEQSMLTYADSGIDQPQHFASLATLIRDILQKGEKPDTSINNKWNAAIDVLAYGWPFMDSHILHHAHAQLTEVLLQAEMDELYAMQLISTLQIPSIKMGSPSNITRAIWTSGILAMLSCDQRLNTKLRNLIKNNQFISVTTCDAQEAREQAINIIADELLLRTEFDDRSRAMWEAWIAIVNQLHKTTGTSNQQMHLIKSILHSNIDLLRESTTRDVLGRLINSTDWTASSRSRDAICELIKSDEYKRSDVSLLTSLFLNAPNVTWFNKSYLVHHNHTIEQRAQIANRLQAQWPLDTSEVISIWNLSIPAGFDVDLVQQWIEDVDQVIKHYDGKVLDVSKLRMLNEAATSIWKGRPYLALHAMEKAEKFTIDVSDHFKSAHQEIDGTFTKLYLDVGKDEYEQLGVIDSLLNGGETDLGQRDADLLAAIALASNKSRIRLEATRVIIEQFPNGRTVAIALLNNFDKAKTKEQITTIVANLTDVILPPKDSFQWSSSARRAFVQHALTAGNKNLWELDESSNAISTSLISEFLMLNPEHLPMASEVTPNDAIEMVVETWRRAIPPKYHPKKQIEFTPTGVLQFYLHKQLEYYSLLKAEESRWRSVQHPAININNVLQQLHSRITILEQIGTVEIAISTHWIGLFKELISEYVRRNST